MSLNPAAIVEWYRANRRDLPWRREVSPYRTLVSELMCQQTQIVTVLPYFERFMAAFPTVEALARAEEQQVLGLWAGLGYYSRARNLHRAAGVVADAGGFPSSLAGLLELPGVGAYTAGAIASTALGLDAALVDGNVERVLARVLALTASGTALRKATWAEAERGMWAAVHAEPGSAGDYNQGLMEIGALLCTPRAPACDACPIATACAGRASPEQYPVKLAKKPSPVVRATALLRVVDGHVWLAQRPAGLLGGLWEPPTTADWLTGGRTVGSFVHVFSHRRLEVDVRDLSVASGVVAEDVTLPAPVLTTGSYIAADWFPVTSPATHPPLSTLARKALAHHSPAYQK